MSTLSDPISIIPTASVPVPLTPAQRAKMVAIEAAIGLLNDASVSFVLFASPDETITPDMKLVHGQRFSYATDLATITRETTHAKMAVLESAMKIFSLGLNGGLSAYSSEGYPICVWQQGKSMAVKRTSKEPQVTA